MMRQDGHGLGVGEPVHETAEGWYFTHHFVDLESMTSKTRQFFQSKREDVGMRGDPVRLNQIRFNKGQSKAIRNCILHAMPRELVLQAIQAAKKGVSAKMDAFIKAKGLAAAQQYTVGQLKTLGVDEAAILSKVGQEKVAELSLDDLVLLAGDYKAIENGDATADELFELNATRPAAAADLKSKLKSQVEQAAAKAAPHPTDVLVKPGTMPFTYDTADRTGAYLTHVDGDRQSCNCGHQPDGGCRHVAAVEMSRRS
jgi:hypothetical protein